MLTPCHLALLLTSLAACNDPTAAEARSPPAGVQGSAGVPASPLAPPAPPPPAPAPTPPPTVSVERARAVLFGGGGPACADARCLVAARYPDAPDALALYDEFGDVPGVEAAFVMDGGFRGAISIVPEWPVGRYAPKLAWVLAAQREIAAFDEALRARGAPGYRHGAVVWRFLRSKGRTTPSAYASGWEVGFNVVGSLLKTREGVRDTVFHELFHLHDEAHGNWSRRALGPLVDALIARCGTDVECLRPYAPGGTRVRGGTWYAFQPNNGDVAHEYAAELATRFYREWRTPPAVPFKCAAPENMRVWQEFSAEFFGGVDPVGACP